MDLMNRVFQSYVDSFVIVLIDNLKNEGEHIDYLRVVLEVVKENQLCFKNRKCEFWLRSVAFLGHIISSEGVKLNPRKSSW